MTEPAPRPGWYPDPSGIPTQRYFDGTEWTGQVAPLNLAPLPLPPSLPPNTVDFSRGTSMRKYVTMAIAGPLVFAVSFFLMQLAFGAAAGAEGSQSVLTEIVGYGLFLTFAASAVATVIGVIGALVQVSKRR